jgi:RNA recognition motif-containing protein
MDRKALQAFRNAARKQNEQPNVENNYFTTTPKDKRFPQLTDWIPTCIASEWCEYHGPSQHTPDQCSMIGEASTKKTEPKRKAQKPKIDPKAFADWQKQVSRTFRPFSLCITNKSHRSRRISSC